MPFQNILGRPKFEGFCEYRKNDDPMLFLAPAKVRKIDLIDASNFIC